MKLNLVGKNSKYSSISNCNRINPKIICALSNLKTRNKALTFIETSWSKLCETATERVVQYIQLSTWESAPISMTSLAVLKNDLYDKFGSFVKGSLWQVWQFCKRISMMGKQKYIFSSFCLATGQKDLGTNQILISIFF